MWQLALAFIYNAVIDVAKTKPQVLSITTFLHMSYTFQLED